MYTIVKCTYIYNSLPLSDGHLIDLRMIDDEKGLTTTEVKKKLRNLLTRLILGRFKWLGIGILLLK